MQHDNSGVWAEYKKAILEKISDYSFVFENLKQKRPGTDGWMTALCPFHEDKNPSFAFKPSTGAWVCFGGCGKGSAFDFLMHSSGMRFKDALVYLGAKVGIEPPGGRSNKDRITVESLAKAKGLPVEVLVKFGVENLGGEYGGVKIPYYIPDGSLAARHRIRTALAAREGSRWTGKKEDGEILPYCLHFLKHARRLKYIILVEGESDCWTLWFNKFPALGLPGAETAGKLKREYFDGIDKVYIWREPDDGGTAFVEGVTTRFAEWKTWKGELLVVSASGVKDPNDLFRKAPAALKDSMKQALGAAIAISLPENPPDASKSLSPAPDASRPVIDIQSIVLDVGVDKVLDALAAKNNPPVVFVRGGALCRVIRDERGIPRIDEFNKASLRLRISECVYFTRPMGRSGTAYTTPPDRIVESVLNRGAWPFPPLDGIVTVPVLRPDGTVHDTPGYDDKTGMYYVPDELFTIPHISHAPSDAEIADARNALFDLVRDFPFDGESSRANALSLVFSLIMRPAIHGCIPLLLVDAPIQGTGKTLLVITLGQIACGTVPVQTAPTGMRDGEEEWRKRITSVFIRGSNIALIDNLPEKGVFDSAVFAAMITSPTWEDRMLGKNILCRYRALTIWVATGNNIRTGGDIPRRSYTCRLDANAERPWERSGFEHKDLAEFAKENRGKLLAAVYMLIRAWYARGCPAPKNIPTFGSFEEWSFKVGGVLENAGINGFLGNLATTRTAQDDIGTQWNAFFASWRDVFGTEHVTAKMVADNISGQLSFNAETGGKSLTPAKIPDESLPEIILINRERGEGSLRRSIGKSLAALTGRIFHKHKLVDAGRGSTNHVRIWQLEPQKSVLTDNHNISDDKKTPFTLSERLKSLGISIEEFEERATVMEYEGGLPRDKAEQKAIEDLLAIKNSQKVI
jgi:hypothetical protein